MGAPQVTLYRPEVLRSAPLLDMHSQVSRPPAPFEVGPVFGQVGRRLGLAEGTIGRQAEVTSDAPH